MNGIAIVSSLGCAGLFLAGLTVLRRRWLGLPPPGRGMIVLGWALIGIGLVAFVEGFGGEVGTVNAALAFSVVAYGVVAAGVERRAARTRQARSLALDPQERRTGWGRGMAKAFLAIVLAGIASIGLGLAFAVGMPLATHERIVIGGLLVPILWGAGMAWTLCDAKLLRATAVLVCASVFGYGVAFLPKLLAL